MIETTCTFSCSPVENDNVDRRNVGRSNLSGGSSIQKHYACASQCMIVLVHHRRTYTSVIKACAKSEPADLARACEAADKMMSAKVPLDVYSLTELLRCCARADPPRCRHLAPRANRSVCSIVVHTRTHTHIYQPPCVCAGGWVSAGGWWVGGCCVRTTRRRFGRSSQTVVGHPISSGRSDSFSMSSTCQVQNDAT